MELWTLDELTERVEAALADYPGQVNGRVRAVPDRRAIRWYATIGLVDRPAEMRGRTALYSRRHLLQLVAIKRRQAQGHTLAQIQAELAGATDESLQPIATLPANTSQPPRPRFWTDRPQPTPATAEVAEFVTAVRLADGVTVVLDQAAPTTPDAARLAAAAAPLLAELARQRLVPRLSGDET